MQRYFSQNDPHWRLERMGKSSEVLGVSGCTTTTISDASSFFNETKTPRELAKLLEYTPSGKILWYSINKVFKHIEFEYRYYDFKLFKKEFDEAWSNPNKVILLNVNYGKHWVYLCGSPIPFFGYKVNDPYPFPSVMKRYKPSEIVGFTVLRKK